MALVHRLFDKPWDDAELKDTLREALKAGAPIPV